MKIKEFIVFLVFRFLVASSTSCKDNPSQMQCLAFNNRFLLPRHSACNPLRTKCRMGDLVDNRVASCRLRYSGNEQHSLDVGYKLGHLYRCIPRMDSLEHLDKRVLSVDAGEPRCTGVEKSGRGKFTCGERGTRCVCDAPKGIRYIKDTVCRCQYFIDFCSASKVCRDSKASCATSSNKVACACPSRSRTCTLGINQCSIDSSLCSDLNSECIELYDELSSWNIGGENRDEGYACVNRDDIKLLKRNALYCSVSAEKLPVDEKPLNHIDACCHRLLTCGSKDKKITGDILSYRQCYCSTLFRECLVRYQKTSVYIEIVHAAIRTINQLKSCDIDDGTTCDPSNPKTCRKGDFINPLIAHCRINCNTGPLLPIGQRMCSIRQCKPANHVEGARIIDVPQSRTSSLCKAVRSLPFLCGKGDTRCVCDSKPSEAKFTDGCRCQFWPLVI